MPCIAIGVAKGNPFGRVFREQRLLIVFPIPLYSSYSSTFSFSASAKPMR